MSSTLSVYFGERARVSGRLVADALLDLCADSGVAASVLLRGLEGFGIAHHLRTDTSLSLSEDLPAVLQAVDTDERIAALTPRVRKLVPRGVVSVERGHSRPPTDAGSARLTVHLGRKDRIDGRPAFHALTDLLHRRGVAGATTLLGVDGTAAGVRERARFFARNTQVPMVTTVVGACAELAAFDAELALLLPRAIRTLRPAQVCKRDGALLGVPSGSGWQRLTVYTSEAALHGGTPIHRAIVRRLRSGGVRGATTLRGVWGFHGDHDPHGDRLFQLGRRVPAVTAVLDTADRIAAAFKIVDELTAERGLVIVEPVAAATLLR